MIAMSSMPEQRATKNGDLIAVGGRVLTVTALGDDTASARKNAYEVVTKIAWDNSFYRSDIANV